MEKRWTKRKRKRKRKEGKRVRQGGKGSERRRDRGEPVIVIQEVNIIELHKSPLIILSGSRPHFLKHPFVTFSNY